jgi:hypothetical protein
MNVEDIREERRTALDEFARSVTSPPEQTMNMLPITAGFDVITAQPVKVHRDEARVLQRIRALAAAAGSDWFYRIPFRDRKKGTVTYVEGLSIKGANEVAREFGNNFTDVRMQDLGDSWIFYAKFTDLQSGFGMVRPYQQRKSASRIGGDDDARRLDIAFAIGVSKCIRNVITNSLQSYCDFALEEAKGALVDKIGKDLPRFREQTIERIGAHVDIARVEAVIGRPRGDWTAPDVAKVIAMGRAVTDGMSTWNETFPPLGGAEDENGEVESSAAATRTLESFAAGPGADQIADPQANAGATSASDAPETLAEDIFDTIRRRMAAAPTPEAVHEVWETLELDAYFEDDKKGRDKAWKIAQRRLDELK